MAVLTPVRDEEAREFVRAYGLGELESIEGIPAGSVNSNFSVWVAGSLACSRSRLFLRIYEEQDEVGALAEAALLTNLELHGVATPAPVAGRIGRLSGKPAALFPWREGRIRCQASVTASDMERVGAELARIHTAPVDAPAGRFRFEDLLVRLDRVETDPRFAAHAAPLRAKLRASHAHRRELPSGLIHGDLFRDNVLWQDESITALLDFESASRGPFAYDLMVTALAWCFGDKFDRSLFRALVSGYESVRLLAPIERESLRDEGIFAALRFSITRITDYAMRVTDAPRVVKDYKRFLMRLETLESLESLSL